MLGKTGARSVTQMFHHYCTEAQFHFCQFPENSSLNSGRHRYSSTIFDSSIEFPIVKDTTRNTKLLFFNIVFSFGHCFPTHSAHFPAKSSDIQTLCSGCCIFRLCWFFQRSLESSFSHRISTFRVSSVPFVSWFCARNRAREQTFSVSSLLSSFWVLAWEELVSPCCRYVQRRTDTLLLAHIRLRTTDRARETNRRLRWRCGRFSKREWWRVKLSNTFTTWTTWASSTEPARRFYYNIYTLFGRFPVAVPWPALKHYTMHLPPPVW